MASNGRALRFCFRADEAPKSGTTIAGLTLNLLNIDPIGALFIAAIINGLVAAPLMVLIALLGSDREVMGERRSGHVSMTWTWIATAVMAVGAVALLSSSLLP